MSFVCAPQRSHVEKSSYSETAWMLPLKYEIRDSDWTSSSSEIRTASTRTGAFLIRCNVFRGSDICIAIGVVAHQGRLYVLQGSSLVGLGRFSCRTDSRG